MGEQVKVGSEELEALGLDCRITRRDMVGATILGSGAALLGMASPGFMRTAAAQTLPAPLSGLTTDWTGPGGLGDYRNANGNTHEVVNAAHSAIRNETYHNQLRRAQLTDDTTYDLIVVGAGFSGLSATISYTKEKQDAKCLILDNHAIFGGEAKQNEFEVDGTHLWASQGSHGTMYPIALAKEWGESHDYWDLVGLPNEFQWQELTGTAKDIKVPWDVYSPMGFAWEQADTGFFYEGHGFVINPFQNGFRDAPIPDDLKISMLAAEMNREPVRRKDWDTYLDSITYADFLATRGVDPRVKEFLDPYIAAIGLGLGCDAVSAYGAYNFLAPHLVGQFLETGLGDPSDRSHLVSLPGGNGSILRYFAKHLIPGAIPGDRSDFSGMLFNPVNFDVLDKPGEQVRIRLNATVMDVRHDGPGDSGTSVVVTYLKDGNLHRVKGRGVVMACGQWVNKRVVSDLPGTYREAMDFFQHAPMLTVNVAVRNWKFMEKLGIAAARWFEGFGWWLSLKRQVLVDGMPPMPLDPNKPAVLTLYIPFPVPGLPIEQQTVTARMKMFSMSYRDIEIAIRQQLTTMFAAHGFDAKRDIAGIITNRWGHAYIAPQPGFFFGRNGAPAPKDIIRKRFGRIAFAHAEISGMQVWPSGAREGERAGRQILEIT